MFADIGKQEREWRTAKGTSKEAAVRAQQKYRRKLKVYKTADRIYLAVHQGRPRPEIDKLLERLRELTRFGKETTQLGRES